MLERQQVLRMVYCGIHLPANETEDVEGQIKDGKGSKWDEEEDDSQTPPSPDGQTGLKQTHS